MSQKTSGATDTFNFGTLSNMIDVVFALSTVTTAKGNGTAVLQSYLSVDGETSTGESFTPSPADYVSYHTLFWRDSATDGQFTLKRFNRIRTCYQLV